MFNWIRSKITKSLIKYIFVGGSAFAADYATLLVLYYGASVALGVATTCGFFTGFIISFYMNRKWVFGDAGSSRKLKRQLVEYLGLVVFNYLFTVFAVSLLNDLGVMPWLGKLLVMVLITGWNYMLFSRFIFSKKTTSLS